MLNGLLNMPTAPKIGMFFCDIKDLIIQVSLTALVPVIRNIPKEASEPSPIDRYNQHVSHH